MVSKPICPKGYYLPSYSPGTLRKCIEQPPSTFEGDTNLIGPPTVNLPPPEPHEVCHYEWVSLAAAIAANSYSAVNGGLSWGEAVERGWAKKVCVTVYD